jgi:hypothetical protein
VPKDFWNIQSLEHVDIEERKKEKRDISFVYFLAKVLDGMSVDHSVDVSGELSITAKAGPLDPAVICVGETARRTEAWQVLPFKSVLNKNMQPIHKKEKQRSWLVFMLCCKTSRKSNKTTQTKPEISFLLSPIYLHA